MEANHDAWESFKKERAQRVAGALSLVLYAIVALGVLSRLVLHVRHGSGLRRVTFHVLLLHVIVGNIPFNVQAVFYPRSQRWIGAFVAELLADTLLCCALAMLSIAWARVAMVGQYAHGPVRFKRFIIGISAAMVLAMLATDGAVFTFSDDVAGVSEYNDSVLHILIVSLGSVVILFTSSLLLFQATRIYRRMLQSRSMLSATAFSRSATKLFLSVWIIMLCNVLRVFFIVCGACEFRFVREMDVVPHTVWASLVPEVFPVICLLYLQRRMPAASCKVQRVAVGTEEDALQTVTATMDAAWNDHASPSCHA
ncbi:hypothetical protein SDRG_13439 [Saprolegnia diclina VS20]|uniref:THH1/TOM1/TOM3 domain-containing protein n=1 Tax=Saprolegnia diclina (strain VS20) TaxID=1156394 RepID=T0Q5P2_SAPDV|nr:hypothetical protein SDRG_13439 [Saprolegnia diclina VS20]EQC28755.1 hypothetical protein SDRG_13439 [Saprolegnia diclina VS20]|eukprot:XP_008617750.1 hypothetical protein SDRG_13439 [Saprolegnia diclina VS20]